jgi:plastocyanin
MKTKITFLLISLLTALFFNTTKATVYTVSVGNYYFSPSTLDIKSGDTVEWVWRSGGHTTTSTSVPTGANSWDASMTSTSTQYEMKFTVAGLYKYECMIHPTMMQGTITVTAASGLTDYNNDSYEVKAYPNPFSDKLYISFNVPETGATKIRIFDVTGKLVRILVDNEFAKGNHIVIWDGKNEEGESVSHGLYFYLVEYKNLSKIMQEVVFGS